ncbi:MAG TPA: helix-turn-helix domain-containing protein [Mycobacteriales bacterium]|nr:helix-turn-helix domain-containing protein [Mycobacteriales bacterium]HWA65403.1 helix-turn-helix domain-containing protein [Mycobacteriales bacterium]
MATRAAAVPPSRRLRDKERSPAQLRVLEAALALFAEHGVSGTSLQMIADHMGVTKAAVYHQFKTKDEIVLAVAQHEFRHLEAALETAQREPSKTKARAALLVAVVDMAVARRRWVRALQNDPVMIRLLASDEELTFVLTQIYGTLIGGSTTPEARVSVALLAGAMGVSLVHPLVVDLDDATLRKALLKVARRTFEIPGRPPGE